ncbi:MAG: hypothetical protein UD936_05470 [Acutalibacteraceae bacterium]|nr:hypothetical protein [Acutalibacteraceae bacterium]
MNNDFNNQNHNLDYSDNQKGYNPYQNNNTQPFNQQANLNNYINPQPFNQQANLNNYINLPVGYNQNMYADQYVQTGETPYKEKAVASFVLGLVSCFILAVSIVAGFFFLIVVIDSDPTNINSVFSVGLNICMFAPVVALILGIIGMVKGSTYQKKARALNVHKHKGKAAIGITFSVIGVCLSAICALSCMGCAACHCAWYGGFIGTEETGYVFNFKEFKNDNGEAGDSVDESEYYTD